MIKPVPPLDLFRGFEWFGKSIEVTPGKTLFRRSGHALRGQTASLLVVTTSLAWRFF